MKTIAKKMMLSGYKGEPSVECMIEIDVDDDGIAQHLGEKAYRNKSKRSSEIHGLVKVRVRPTSANA